MMRSIVGSSAKFGRLVLAVALALLAFGIFQLRGAPVDVYPEFMPPTVQIQTEALGLSAAEVEQLITVPLEQDLLNGVPWLDQIRSESMPGLSSVDLVFDPGTNLLRARQMVQERLSQVAGLPNVGSRPVMLQPVSSTSRVMMIGLSPKDLSLIEMSVLARWKIRPRLMGIPGVANVAIWGQRDRQLQVQVDPARLRKYGVSLDQVIGSTGNALWSSPLSFVEASTPGTGGFIDTANQRFGVQHILPITTPKQLASVTLEDTSGKTLRLGDVAGVVEDHQPLIGDAVVHGGPSLLLVIQKFPDANTLEVTEDVEEAMAAMAPGLAGIEIDTTVFRPATFIESALHNVGTGALVSLILVLALFAAIFLSWRVALVGLITIPVSVVVAAYVLYLRGTTFNTMILSGLAVALALVIDDAVVDIDNIRRRLLENRESGYPRSPAATVVEASLEVRRPLVYATLILALAAVFLAVQPGVAGSFSRPLALSYALAVLASTVVALTLTPALALMLLPAARLERRASPLVQWAQRPFSRGVPRHIRSARWTFGTVALLLVAGLAVVPQLGSRSLLPAPRDRDLLVRLEAPPGTSLPRMDQLTSALSRDVESVQGVRDVGVHVGRAVTSDQAVNVNAAEMWVSIAGSADHDATVAAVQRVLDGHSQLRHNLLTYEQERLRAASSGTGHALVVRVFGQDLRVLRAQAEQVRRVMSAVDGVEAPRVEGQAQEPTLQVEVDLAAAQRYGVKPGDVRRAATTMLSGLLVGNLYEQQKVFDVVVWGTPATRASVDGVRNLVLDTPSGRRIRLQDVASVRLAPYPTSVKHNDVSRSIDVTAGIRGRSRDSVARDVQDRVRALHFPLEYHAEVVNGARGSGRWTLGFALAAIVGIFLLLEAATSSWRAATLLFLLIPLAAVGGALTGYLAGGIMSAGALMGFLVVLGIVVRNGILLVRSYQRLADEGEADDADLVARGTAERAAPIVLAALAIAAAATPFAVLGDLAGAEILHPLAVVVLGGVVTSTMVTLLVLPGLYLRFVLSGRIGRPESTPPPTEPPPAEREKVGDAAP